MEDALDLIVGCTQIDEARLLTKTLRRTHPNTGKEPHVRALALGIVTGADHTPITTAQPYVDRYGADTVRGYMAFMGPHQNDTRFSEAHIGGVQRFLSRLSEVARDLPPHLSTQRPASAQADRELLRKTHQTHRGQAEAQNGHRPQQEFDYVPHACTPPHSSSSLDPSNY
jgi:leucyl-tRNA synthetase